MDLYSSDFSLDNIVFGPVITKIIPSHPNMKYHIIPINKKCQESGELEELIFKGPEMESQHGITTHHKDKITASPLCASAFAPFLNRVYYGCRGYGVWINNLNPVFNMHLINNKNTKIFDTVFIDPEGREIPWECLRDKYIKFIPLLRFKRVSIIRGRPNLDVEIINATITDCSPNKKYGRLFYWGTVSS